MNTFQWLAVAVSVVLAPLVLAGDEPQSLGPETAIVLPAGDENPCPPAELLCNFDGSFEGAYAWQYAGVVPPYYGAFAEGYSGTGSVCGTRYAFTTLSGYYTGQTMDVYVWDSDGQNPSEVLGITPGVSISPPAIWPVISLHDVDNDDVEVSGDFFVGFWGEWPGVHCGWFCGEDDYGFGGQPRTNIAPGIGYPTGWQNPEIVWGPNQAIGICAYLGAIAIATEGTSWGRIKSLY